MHIILYTHHHIHNVIKAGNLLVFSLRTAATRVKVPHEPETQWKSSVIVRHGFCLGVSEL